jgi:ADP-ribose pyrophosphatase YjhB (NUDIX family)/ribosomal protein S27AE
MRFCSSCGSSRLDFRIPDGDSLPRFVCGECGEIHYQNPKVVVGWLPAGFLENGESLSAGAARETLEEAGATVEVGELYTVISLPQIHQVYMVFRAALPCPEFAAGTESLEVRLFDEQEIPWDRIAFRTIARTLRNFFLDRKLGAFPTRVSVLERRQPVPPDLRGAG